MNKNINVFIKNKKWLFRMADRIGKYAVRYMPKAIYERIEVDVNFPCLFGIPAEVILQDLQWERRPWVHDFVKKIQGHFHRNGKAKYGAVRATITWFWDDGEIHYEWPYCAYDQVSFLVG